MRDASHLPTCVKPIQPRNYETRLAATIWQSDDDVILQRLCHQFPFNWQLISDAFNTARRTLSIDRRSPWDCFQRWNKKWNPTPESKEVEKKDGPTSEPGVIDPLTGAAAASTGGAGAGAGAVGPVGAAAAAAGGVEEGTSALTTTPAGATSNPAPTPTVPGMNATKKAAAAKLTNAILDPMFEGSKKKLRHAKLYDAMKKTAKRRDLTNRKPQSTFSPVMSVLLNAYLGLGLPFLLLASS